MSLTDSIVTYTGAIKSLIEANNVVLGFQGIYYGDQQNIPKSPSLAVEPGTKVREIAGASRAVTVTLTSYVLIYHSRIEDTQNTRFETDLFAESVERLIHTSPTLSGIVVHCFVSSYESGYTYRNGTTWRSARLTVEGLTRVNLPMET